MAIKMNKKFLLTSISLITFFSTNALSQGISINNDTLYSKEQLIKNYKKAFKEKDYLKAENLLKKLIKKEPKNENIQLDLGVALFYQKKYSESESIFYTLSNKSSNTEVIDYSNEMIEQIQLSQLKISQTKKKNRKPLIKIVLEDTEEKNLDPLHYLTIDNKKHYLCNNYDPSVIDFEDGEFFTRWEINEMPIVVYIPQPDRELTMENRSLYIDTVKKAFNRWQEKTSGKVKFTYTTSEVSSNVVVKWIDYFKSESAIGVAKLPKYNVSKKRRVSELTLAVKAQEGIATFSDEKVMFSQDELYQIALHEIGHVLGLAHSFPNSSNPDIMSPTYREGYPVYSYDITDRDLNSLNVLYSLPRKKRIVCK